MEGNWNDLFSCMIQQLSRTRRDELSGVHILKISTEIFTQKHNEIPLNIIDRKKRETGPF